MPSNSCKHPLKAFKIGINEKTGKDLLKITSYDMDHVELVDNSYIPVQGSFVSRNARRVFRDWQAIPCGQCIGCRLQYSRDWANRCSLEMKSHKSTLFLTITYDNSHLPTHYVKDYINDEGEIIDEVCVHSLVKKDFQDFMKSLRYYFPENDLRYFACGEYGDISARPHYHAIIFGLDPDDLVFYKRVQTGNLYYNYYTSEKVNKAWKHKGFVIIAPATWESIAYTSRYCTKKLYGQAGKVYDDLDLVPPFVLMSRRPGIANDYFEHNFKDIFSTDRIYISA